MPTDQAVGFLRYLLACAAQGVPFDLQAHVPRIERILKGVDHVEKPKASEGRRHFPLLRSLSDRRKHDHLDIPNSVPWELLEPLKERAKRNHSQTLLDLARRGGLSVYELRRLIEDRPLFPLEDDFEDDLRAVKSHLLSNGYHVKSLTTEDRDGCVISPTCAHCGRDAECCDGY